MSDPFQRPTFFDIGQRDSLSAINVHQFVRIPHAFFVVANFAFMKQIVRRQPWYYLGTNANMCRDKTVSVFKPTTSPNSSYDRSHCINRCIRIWNQFFHIQPQPFLKQYWHICLLHRRRGVQINGLPLATMDIQDHTSESPNPG